MPALLGSIPDTSCPLPSRKGLQNLSIRYMFSSHNNYNTKLLKVQLRCQRNQQVVLDPFPKVDIAGIIQDTGRM